MPKGSPLTRSRTTSGLNATRQAALGPRPASAPQDGQQRARFATCALLPIPRRDDPSVQMRRSRHLSTLGPRTGKRPTGTRNLAQHGQRRPAQDTGQSPTRLRDQVRPNAYDYATRADRQTTRQETHATVWPAARARHTAGTRPGTGVVPPCPSIATHDYVTGPSCTRQRKCRLGVYVRSRAVP